MVIKQSEVNSSLMNKLKEEDINFSSSLCKKGADKNKLIIDIMCRNNCNCSVKSETKFTLPEGNVSTDIMIVGGIPSEVDGVTHTTMFDANGRLMTVILDKLGLKRDNIYITNVCKCYINTSSIERCAVMDTVYECASRFLLREISMVKPKTIITLGLETANTIRQLLLGFSEIKDISEVRGKVFNGDIDEHSFNIIHTYDPSFILSKSGALYEKYKMDLWKDISSVFKKGGK